MPKVREPRVYKRADSPYYMLVYYSSSDGSRVRRTSGATTRKDALKELDRRVQEEAAVAREGKAPIDDGFLYFLKSQPLKPGGYARYDTSRKAIQKFFDAQQPAVADFSQIDKAVLYGFIDHRRENGCSDQTIRNDLAFISSVWEVLADHPDWEKVMPANPVTRKLKKRVKPSRKRLRCASDAEWAALLAATTTEQQRQILTVLVETGLRETELCGLKWSMVDFKNKQISLIPDMVNIKDDDARVIPLTDLALGTLRGTVRHKLSQYVFWHLDHEGKPKPFVRFQNFWQAVRERSGVTNFKLHDIRHTFATRFLNRTGDLMALSRILGHSSVQVTEKYAFLLTGTLHAQMRKMNKGRKSIPVAKGIVTDLAQKDGIPKSHPVANASESVEIKSFPASKRGKSKGLKDGVMISTRRSVT